MPARESDSAVLEQFPEGDLELLQAAAPLVTSAWASGLETEPHLTVSEWADRHRVLLAETSAEPGPYRTDRAPYLREIMDSLSARSPVERVVFMKASQVGATEAANNWLGYVIQHAPGSMLYLLPTIDVARKASKQRISPMLDATPSLADLVSAPKAKHAENTILSKDYPGGTLTIAGANSASSLAHISVRYLFADECDRYPADVDEEGNPLALAIKRTDTFKSVRKIFITSTPTIDGLSNIQREFDQSDQRYFEVPCPHCGTYQFLTWTQIKFNPDKPADAVLVCLHCKADIQESYKAQMLADGRWMPTAEGDGRTRGYHLNALYSPPGWYSWGDAALDCVKAKSEGRESVKVWVNTVLGETFEEDGKTIEVDPLLARVESYPARVPAGALVLTCGVDVQDNRVELEVVGWGPGQQSWGVEYKVIWGDPSQPTLWKELQAFLDAQWENENGDRLNILATCVDSGDGGHTKDVYKFTKGKAARRIFSIKGMDGARPIVSSPSRKRTGRDQRKVDLFIVGTDQARSLVHSRLRIEELGPGRCHFPKGWGYDKEWFKQITSMKVRIRYRKGIGYREWHLIPGRRKEAFDCRVYALAALEILNPHWESLLRIERKKRKAPAAAQAPSSRETPSPAPAHSVAAPAVKPKPPRRRSGGSWATRWKKGY